MALLLACIMSLSLITPVNAGVIDNAAGGYTGTATSAGHFNDHYVGYRMYLISRETGARVSDILDILFTQPSFSSGDICYNTKSESFSYVKSIGSVSNWGLKYYPNQQWGTISYANLSAKLDFSSDMPRPLTHNGTAFVGHGADFREWFMNAVATVATYTGSFIRPVSTTTSSNQGIIDNKSDNSSNGDTSGTGEGQVTQSTTSSVINYILNQQYKSATALLDTYGKDYCTCGNYAANHSRWNSGDAVAAAAKIIWNGFDAWASRGVIANTDANRAAYQAMAYEANNTDLWNYANRYVWKDIHFSSSGSYWAMGLSDLTINFDNSIAFADSSDSSSGANEGENMKELVNKLPSFTNTNNLYFQPKYNLDLDKATSTKNAERDANGYLKLATDSNGNGSLFDSLAVYNLAMAVEPIIWVTPGRMDSKTVDGRTVWYERWTSTTWFYGTLTNWAQAYLNGRFKELDPDPNKTGFSSWYAKTFNLVLANSFFLPNDFELTDGTVMYTGVSETSKKVSNTIIANSNQGWGIHLYWPNIEFSIPQTSTYDEPMKDTPHPAPDPSPDNIPLADGEPQEPGDPPTKDDPNPEDKGYLNQTRYINIIKVYDEMLPDNTPGDYTDNEIRHVTTTYRANNPGVIAVEHEPEYKVVEYFTSKDFYGWLPNIDPDTIVWEDLEWETFDYGNESYKLIVPSELISGQNPDGYAYSSYVKEYNFGDVKDGEEGEILTKIWMAYAAILEEKDGQLENGEIPDQTTNPDHPYFANTLYVRLVKMAEEPETSTWDEDSYPEGEPGPPPPPPGNPSDDPDNPDDPDDPDNPDDSDDPYHVTIIKHYKEIEVKTDGSEVVTYDGPYIREDNPEIIDIEDEPEFKLERWFISTDEYSGDPTVQDKSSYEDSQSKFSESRSGTDPEKVKLEDFENTLVLELVKRTYEKAIDADIVITQSQITKAIETTTGVNGVVGNGWGETQSVKWGSKAFSCPGHKHPGHHKKSCSSSCTSSHSSYYTCDWTLNDVNISVGLKDNGLLNSSIWKSMSNTKFDYEYIQHSSEKITRTSTGTQYHTTTTGNYKTYLYRGEDLLTLASYKYSSSDKDLLTLLGNRSGKSPSNTRINNVSSKEYQLNLILIRDTSSKYDYSTTAYGKECSTHACGLKTKTTTLTTEGTSPVYKAKVVVEFYSGTNTPVGNVTVTSPLTITTKFNSFPTSLAYAKTSQGRMLQQSEHIKLYPYINMTYQIVGNQDADSSGSLLYYSAKPSVSVLKGRTDVSVLSQYDFDIVPNAYVEASFTTSDYDSNLLVTSPQWSTHSRATSGSEKWQGKNQVLPGGAIYNLSTTDDDTYVNIVTWQTVLDSNTISKVLPSTSNGGTYTADNAFKQHTDIANQVADSLQNWRIVQYVETNYKLDSALNGLNVTGDGNGGVSLSSLTGYSGKKTSTDTKYLLLSKKLASTAYSGGANCGNLDIVQATPSVTYYKVSSDISGNVTLSSATVSATSLNITRNGMQMTVAGYDPSNIADSSWKVLETITKDQTAFTSQGAKELDERTKVLTNFLTALTRNKGSDLSADWVKDGKWYNEAVDAVYVLRFETQYKVGFYSPNKRASVLDPNLCPTVSSKSDNYTTAVMSQFAMNDKSDIHKDKNAGYLGTFTTTTGEKTDVYLPNYQELFKSNIFYIPNANVQDLNQ